MTEVLDNHVRSLDAEIEEGSARYTIQIRIPTSSDAQKVPNELLDVPGVQRVGISGLHGAD